MLKKLSHTSWGADRETLNTLYKATVISILDYGCQVYGSATEPTLKKLEPIHNEGTRIITGAFRSSPISSIHVEHGELPLDFHRNLVCLKTAARIKASDSPTSQLFNEHDNFEQTPPFIIRASRMMKQMNMHINFTKKIQVTPPWTRNRPSICTKLKLNKKSTNPHIIKINAMEHMNTKSNKKPIYTDGSKSDEGTGYSVVYADNTIKRSLPEHASVFTAELSAINEALEVIRRDASAAEFVIYSDSRSALEAIDKFYPINHIVCQIQEKAHTIIEQGKQIMICWIPAHVGISGNEKADRAAKEAILEQRSASQPPHQDTYPKFKEEQYRKWQLRWDIEPMANKLKQIKDTVKPWKMETKIDRETQVKLTRLRIGHTLLTHGHLMIQPKEDPTKCSKCNIELTINHIIQDCPHVRPQRMQSIGHSPIKEVLGPKVRVSSVMKFLRSVQVFDVI